MIHRLRGGSRRAHHLSGVRGIEQHPVGVDQRVDVLDGLRPEADEADIDLAPNLLDDPVGEADATRLGQGLQARRHVDAGSVDVVAVDDDVADIDTHAELDAAFGRNIGVTLGHAPLDRHRAPQGIDHAGEFDQRAVAHELDDAAPMRGDQGIGKVGAVGLQRVQGSGLVLAHEAGVTDNVRGQDGGQLAVQKMPPRKGSGVPDRDYPMRISVGCVDRPQMAAKNIVPGAERATP